MRKYFIKKYKWNEEVLTNIDWKILDKSLEKNRGLHKITMNKLINFWQHTGLNVRQNHQKVKSTSKCTECQDLDDQIHYMKCKGTYFSEARKFSWKQFYQKMTQYKREETLLRVIWIGIQNWIHNDFEGELQCGDDVASE